MSVPSYGAVLVLSFGGPEKHDDVIPFLENVLRGRNVPTERMLEVAGHYYHFNGKSPINDQNRALIAGLRDELDRNGPRLPVYWGNRNWHPVAGNTWKTFRRLARKWATARQRSTNCARSTTSLCSLRLYRIEFARLSIKSRPAAAPALK